jgi:imidazolonepropionase-like amidohydrolase
MIRHVGVLDVRAGRIERDRDVLIKGDRIAAIGLGGQLPATPGERVIDGRGATLLPGLIDSHGHVSLHSGPSWDNSLPDVEANLRAYLYAGVTRVLDPSDPTPDAVARRDQIVRGELLGPTIHTAGPLLTAQGGHPIAMIETAAPWWIRWYLVPRAGVQIGSPDAARSAIAELAEDEVDFVKLVVDRIPQKAPRMDVATLDAAVDAANRLGLRSVAHIGTVRDALDTGQAGVAAWVHVVYKERIPDESIAQLAAFGIPMVPTLTVWNSYANALKGPRVPSRIERETVPAALLASFDDPPDGSPLLAAFEPYLEMLRAQREHWADNVRRLHAAGVVILAGSDTQSGVFPGAGLLREIELLHRAGLSRAEAIRSATLDAARFLAASSDPGYGEIGVGKRADLLLVEGDPLESLEALSAIRDVILGGVRLERTPVGATPAP